MQGEFLIENLIRKAIEKKRKSFKGSEEELQKSFKKKLPKVLSGLNKTLRDTTLRFCITEFEKRKKQETSTALKIEKRYKTAFQFFDIFLQYNRNLARDVYEKYYALFDTYDDHLKLDTLMEVHARACQIASEINLLARSGYADGALARWRSLHEVSVLFLFLYDNDYSVVKMYNDYAFIEACDKARKYQQAYPQLGWKTISEKEMKVIEANRQVMIDKYGNDFGKSYGWTMSVLAKDQRTIRGIENAVKKDYLRGIYSWASDNVHAGTTGNKNRLGLPDSKQKYFLTGPTEHGLLDPLQLQPIHSWR